jgi:cytochrome b
MLVLAIFCAWASFRYADALGDPTLRLHRWNGYFILVLVIFRLIWGFVGSSTSRFKAFITWPWHAARYGLDLLKGRDRHFLGHNPLGSWMIVVLLIAVFVQGSLGLFSLEHNELVAGPLKRLVAHETSERITKLHVMGINVIFGLVLAHVSANIFYSRLKKDPLIKAMVSGRKPRANYEDQLEAHIPRNVTMRACVSFLAAAVAVFGGITALGGRIL